MAVFILLKFLKIFYSKKVFFVPPYECQIAKITSFDPCLLLGAGSDLPIFVIRAHECSHHISLVRIRDTFAIVRTLVSYSWNGS